MRVARSIWFTAPKEVTYKERVLHSPKGNEIEIRTLFSGISHGTEMLIYRGQAPTNLELDPSISTMEGSFSFPIKYGYSSVGEVADLGAKAANFGKGDIVFAHNPHETEYVIPEDLAVKLPNRLSCQQGIFLANLETAINCILDAGINLGEDVAVFGQGVVGLLITQLVRRSGAGKIFTVDKIEHRRNLSLRLGADVAFDPMADDVPQAIRENTEGRGADVIVEASGSPEALNEAIKVVAFQGTVVVVSWYGIKPVALSLGEEFHRNRIRIKSSQVSYIDPALTPRWSAKRRMSLALKLLPQLNLEGLISHIYPFEEAPKAYEKIDKNPEEVLQVILKYV